MSHKYGPNITMTQIAGIGAGTTAHIHSLPNRVVNQQFQLNGGINATNLNVVGAATGNIASTRYTSIITFVNPNGQEVVRLEADGSVVWANGIQVDEAAEALGKAMYLSVEQKSGVTEGTKRRMRDTVFQEIINLVKDADSITVEELTRYWEAAKIMDKLKGAE